MKIFTTSQVRLLDRYTIDHEPIASIDLMERAAYALFYEYVRFFNVKRPVLIMAGPGNNGGDALALARKLLDTGVDVSVVLIHQGKLSGDCAENKNRLPVLPPEKFSEQSFRFEAPLIGEDTVVVDGLFGSGLNRPLDGIFAEAIGWINHCGCEVLSIDIPSGLQGESNPNLTVPIVKATYTFTLQFPKLAFLLPGSAAFAGNWSVLDIGIHPEAIRTTPTPYKLTRHSDIQPLLPKRGKFTHKGTYGHVLILAGSKDMAGAAVLASRAALRSGAGLVTVHSASCNRNILQTAVPEAIFRSDRSEFIISEAPQSEKYDAVALGPGIGTAEPTIQLVEQLLGEIKCPCVIDADALNIIGLHKRLLALLTPKSVLTPHPKEFERLFGPSAGSYERMLLASEMAQLHHIIIVLKGAHTLIALPDGSMWFNSTGNAGMATAGAGDLLTGIIAALLAQGYTPENAALTGVYLHGLAGDKALSLQSPESLVAGDITEHLGRAFHTFG
jgi:NAD(P)H-hydrate epimerase